MFALIIKISLFEGIFVDAKGVNCTSLVIASTIFISQTQNFFVATANVEIDMNSITFQDLLCINL